MNEIQRLTPADRDRAVHRLRGLTIGTAVAGIAATAVFGVAAAASYPGKSSADATVSIDDGRSIDVGASTESQDDTTITSTPTPAPTVVTVPRTSSGGSHATSGASG